MATNAESIAAEYTRLHITPLNPSLLTAILPPSILPSARNISYHTIQTFPERAYGYVDLPTMDAEKIKKKLNGSILKGTKVRIEKAREQKEMPVDEDEEPARPRKERKSKKRKRGDDTIPGTEIGERSVKRGWTTPGAKVHKSNDKDKRAVVKSKYTTGSECLFKTVLLPNVAMNTGTTSKSTKKETGKSSKGKETVVHEFEKTTKYATFLRTNSKGGNTKGVAEFVEGRGWVDEDGNVVEAVKTAHKTALPREMESKISTNAKEHARGNPEEASESENSSSSEEESSPTRIDSSLPIPPIPEDSSTSSSGSFSEDEDSGSETSSSSSEDESEADTSSESPDEEVKTPKKMSRPTSSSGLTIKIPDPILISTPVATAVHPLEALYKRDAKNDNPNPTNPPFSFFGADGDEEEKQDAEAKDHVQIPMTPFTQRDFEFRGIRSAAPTPDTAHANKRFVWPTNKDEDDEGEGADSSPLRHETPAQNGSSSKAEAPESDFQKWFWENRGETNRAWKKRRKMAAKEKRQRENRKRESRV
jgi:hypothetical protein